MALRFLREIIAVGGGGKIGKLFVIPGSLLLIFAYRRTSFYHASLYPALQIQSFLQAEGVWQTCMEQVYRHASNSVCLLPVIFVILGHSRNISSFSIVLCVIVICDL